MVESDRLSDDTALRVFCCYPESLWTQKMSPVRRHSILAIQRRFDVDLLVSGPGWPGFNCSHSLQRNIDRIFPDPDIVLFYKPCGCEGIPALLRPADVAAPKCLRFNEAWWPRRRAVKEAYATGTELIVCHHAVDLPRFKPFRGYCPVVRHIPHCADKEVFSSSKDHRDRDIPVLLTGYLDRKTYPLRSRFADLISSSRIPGVIRSHPSYEMGSERLADAQLHSYARQLARAKIVLVDSSRHQYPLSKYTEAAMAGALVVGDMPAYAPPAFDQFLVEVDRSASDESLAQTILAWLSNDAARTRRAARGQELMLQRFTQADYAREWVGTVRSFLEARIVRGLAA